jgi:hypothetical protein
MVYFGGEVFNVVYFDFIRLELEFGVLSFNRYMWKFGCRFWCLSLGCIDDWTENYRFRSKNTIYVEVNNEVAEYF